MKTHAPGSTLAPSKLMIHTQSHMISKPKPKIRIIHIVAPEIIKTDVEHFRELVQKLTGKSAERRGKKGNTVSSQMLSPKIYAENTRTNMESGKVATLQNMHRTKKENEDICRGGNPNTFFSFFGEVDEFIHDVNEYPLLPFKSSQINTFGVMPLC